MRQARSSGFTLVELIMTLVIVAILASVAAPRFFVKADFDARFFSEDLFSALRYAQKLAVGSGCPVELSLTPSSYVLRQRAACQAGAFSQAVPHPGSGQMTYTGTAPSGVALASSVNPLVFDPLGRALSGALVVSDATVSVGSRSLLVVGETGFVYDPAL